MRGIFDCKENKGKDGGVSTLQGKEPISGSEDLGSAKKTNESKHSAKGHIGRAFEMENHESKKKKKKEKGPRGKKASARENPQVSLGGSRKKKLIGTLLRSEEGGVKIEITDDVRTKRQPLGGYKPGGERRPEHNESGDRTIIRTAVSTLIDMLEEVRSSNHKMD